MSFTAGSQAEELGQQEYWHLFVVLQYLFCVFDISWSSQALQKWVMVVLAEPCSSVSAGLVEVEWLADKAGGKGSRLSRDIVFLKNVD